MKKLVKPLLILSSILLCSCGNPAPTETPTVAPTETPTETPTEVPTETPTETPTEAPQSKKVDIIILAGQSNMEGHSWNDELKKHVSEEKYSEYVTGYEDVLTMYKAGCYGSVNNQFELVPTRIGQGCSVRQFGPELGMAEYFHEYSDALANPVILAKFTVGGTTLYDYWRSPSSATGKNEVGSLYKPFISFCGKAFAKAEEMGFEPTIRGVCWLQGESDGTSAAALEYEELEDNFINDVQADLADYNEEGTIKFINAGIYDSNWVSQYLRINEAKQNNVEKDPENRFFFSTIDKDLTYHLEPVNSPDFYHFDSEPMIKIGRMFAETILLNYVI